MKRENVKNVRDPLNFEDLHAVRKGGGQQNTKLRQMIIIVKKLGGWRPYKSEVFVIVASG
jgi:hypothetical protein